MLVVQVFRDEVMETNTCRHIERETKENKQYCMQCGKLLRPIKGTEVNAIPVNRPGGIEFKSRGNKKENMWMQKG